MSRKKKPQPIRARFYLHFGNPFSIFGDKNCGVTNNKSYAHKRARELSEGYPHPYFIRVYDSKNDSSAHRVTVYQDGKKLETPTDEQD